MTKKTYTPKYCIYEPYTIFFLTFMLLILCIGSIVMSVFFIKKFLLDDFDPTVFLLLVIMLGPWVYVFIGLERAGLLHRLFLRFSIDENGIHCFCFGKKLYKIAWNDVHTFGLIGFSISYVSGIYILFSSNKTEYAPRNLVEINRISQERMIIQYRTDVWESLIQIMPTDMRDKLSYALSKKQDCFHKR